MKKQIIYNVFPAELMVTIDSDESEILDIIKAKDLMDYMVKTAEHHKALNEEALFRIDFGEDEEK